MDSFVDERDFRLLENDKYTFAVLDRILRGECDLVLSDHERLILCHSIRHYPVWIWTPDSISENEKGEAMDLVMKLRPLSKGYRYNLKYELSEYIIDKSRQQNINVGIAMRLFAYDCPKPIEPVAPVDGVLHRCDQNDVEEIASFLPMFYTEIGDEPPSHEICVETAKTYIDENAFFFWKNKDGKTVATCSYKCNQGLASIGSVYTLPEFRRRHYGQHLVYQVTKTVSSMGYMPMLYTNADYIPSNACYEKIGYILRGKLCTIAAKTREI